jgi:hypothetical protein
MKMERRTWECNKTSLHCSLPRKVKINNETHFSKTSYKLLLWKINRLYFIRSRTWDNRNLLINYTTGDRTYNPTFIEQPCICAYCIDSVMPRPSSVASSISPAPAGWDPNAFSRSSRGIRRLFDFHTHLLMLYTYMDIHHTLIVLYSYFATWHFIYCTVDVSRFIRCISMCSMMYYIWQWNCNWRIYI